MFKGYFYNQTIRKTVAVFGSLFNNISVGKRISGKLTKVSRVPLSYGPRSKFLDRINQDPEATKVAIKVPRMSFQITSISPDPSSKLNPLNYRTYKVPSSSEDVMQLHESVPYKISMELTIMARNQDDALQIFEQIVPTFNPEYTVTVTEMTGPGSKTDVPITLTSVSYSDEFEGDLATTRRVVLFTLSFDIRVRFSAYDAFSTTNRRKYIKFTEVDMHDSTNRDSKPIDRVSVDLGRPNTDTPESYTTITTFGFDDE